ncbi:hypothetical protein AURDEDRAFT_117114 [Auricularia subglabra TFB-10046 SS5]|uniref:Uncharacterized protein n=1 Tax=Auricularia subglabra (strain TFB-10046 / SS5) TaxID=717982 RepID=J0LFZ4_AURST|nr:hypothetical protein AURDEDRAFT_117114 [Auricularia subglabra TFB-10046 SS5]
MQGNFVVWVLSTWAHASPNPLYQVVIRSRVKFQTHLFLGFPWLRVWMLRPLDLGMVFGTRTSCLTEDCDRIGPARSDPSLSLSFARKCR